LLQLVPAVQTPRVTLFRNAARKVFRVLSNRSRERAEGEDYQSMRRKAFRIMVLATIALAGCSEAANQPLSRCEPMVAQICSSEVEAQLRDGTLLVDYSSRPEEARVIPLVVPVFRRDGVLATEVDCYANTNSHTYSIVRSDLAISPESKESVDFLKDQHLCVDQGSYANAEPKGVEIASGLSRSAR
jgi:hypothetical protein